MKAARTTSSFLSYFCKRLRASGAYTERRGCAGGGTGRLNLPGEFMTELFKGCLVVLNPVTAAFAFPSLPVSRFELAVYSCFCALMFPRLPFLFSIFERYSQAELVPLWLDENQMSGIFRVTAQTLLSMLV